MILVPYTVTALSRQDIPDTPQDRNVVAGAVVRVFNLAGVQQLIYDNAAGGGGELQKLTNSNGQCTFYIALGSYVADINGNQQNINVSSTDALQETIDDFNADAALQLADQQTDFDALETVILDATAVVTAAAQIDAIKAKATLLADFVRNEFKVWEAPYGQEPKQLFDVVTTTRASEGTVNTPFGVETRAANIARIDYDPLAGEPLGLLNEEQRTNRLLNSLTLSSAALSAGITRTLNFDDSPFGALTATRIQFSGADQRVLYSINRTDADAATIYVKGTAGETLRFAYGNASNFTLTGDWQRLYVQATGSSGVLTEFNVSTFGGATARDILVVAAQLEAGSYPTSYIPTTTMAVTRVKDQNVLTPTHNENEFTVYGEFLSAQLSPVNRAISCGTGSTNRIELNVSQLVTVIGGDSARVILIGYSFLPTERYKVAYKFIDGIVTLAVNGVIIGSTAQSVNRTFASTNIKLSSDTADTQPSTVTFAEADYYPRALSNAEMIALTQG